MSFKCFAAQYAFVLIFLFSVANLININSIFTLIGSVFAYLWSSWQLTKFLRTLIKKQAINCSGKSVLVTVSDNIFGHEIAKKLNSQGFRVFALCLSINGMSVQPFKSSPVKSSSKMHSIAMDITNENDIRRVRREIERHLEENSEQLWAVVNNCGFFTIGEIEWGNIDLIKKIFNINVFGLVCITRIFLPLIRSSSGRIVNINGFSSTINMSGSAFYSMNNSAIKSFSEALRSEMNKWRVKVITIETEICRSLFTTEDKINSILNNVWKETDQEIKFDYGSNYFYAFKERLALYIKSARFNQTEVTDAASDAITNASPQHKYKCISTYTSIMMWFFEHLPVEIIETVENITSLIDVQPRALESS